MPAEEVKSKRPLDTKFRQQKLPAWRPILTPTAVIVAFLAVGTVFLPIGGVVYMASQKVEEVESVDYVLPVDESGPGGVNQGGCCVSNCEAVDDGRVDLNPCTIEIKVTEDMEPPIYMYYKLTRFYQNHRMYVKSRHDPQLAGDSGLAPSDLEATCKVAGSDSNVGWSNPAWDEADEANNTARNAVSPCGLIAYSLFNDSFQLREVTADEPEGFRPVQQTSKDISWESDRDVKFKNAKDGSTGNNYVGFKREKELPCTIWPVDGSTPTDAKTAECEAAKDAAGVAEGGMDPGWCYPESGFCMEDEHFIVWMRTAGLPNFRKLYAKIEEKLYKDKRYSVNIWNGFSASPHNQGTSGAAAILALEPSRDPQPNGNLFPVHAFKGEKYIVLSTTEWIGGKNDFLGIAYLIVGSLCILLALVFFIKSQCSPASDFGSVTNGATAKSESS